MTTITMHAELDGQPTYEALSMAWTHAIECEGIPGARAETRLQLATLRDRKTTWSGKAENDLRFAIDRYLGREHDETV